jgi:hypothetical protein
LDPKLDQELQAVLSKPPPPATEKEASRSYARAVEQLVEKCVETVDAEMAKVVEAKFALGDANSLQRKNIADPKQQANTFVAEMKNRMGTEKSKWPIRTKDQAQDVLDKVEEQLRSFRVHYEVQPTRVAVTIDDAFQKQLFRWLDQTLQTWVDHHNHILYGKTLAAVEEPVGHLAQHLNTAIKPSISPPLPVSSHSLLNELPPLAHDEEIVSKGEAFVESLKGGLNTVAMLAGMVIVPVVGFFSDQQPIHVRALIMGGCVLPIVGFAGWATVRLRNKLINKSEDKGQDVLLKDFGGFLRNRIERLRVELERHAVEYVNQATTALGSQLEQTISSVFSERESQLVRELARVQMEADRLMDRVNSLKQLRTLLSTQVLVEVRKKLRETDAA